MSFLLPLCAAVLLGSASGVFQEDVAEELWIRSTARRLAVDPTSSSEPAPGAAGWRQRTMLLEAYARCGVWAPAGLVANDEDDRVEVTAAKLRVLPDLADSAEEFEARLARGLRSPFGAVRAAALHRAALWALEESALGSRASRLFAAELEGGELHEAVQEPLFQIALKGADGRRFEKLLKLPVAAQALVADGRAGWDPVLGFFEDIVALPLSREEIVGLERASARPGPLACVELVAYVRDGVPIASAVTDRVRSVVSDREEVLDIYELDAVVEAMATELTLPGQVGLQKAGPRAAVADLGEALLVEAARPGLAPSSRDRCLRTAARLLPVTAMLGAGDGFSDAAALEIWDALNRRDDWPETPALLEALLPWLDRDSADVAEAALRAVGARYAYGGRTDLEEFLVKALRHRDATLRSLAFPWLAKSRRPLGPDGSIAATTALDAALFEAWTKEGSQDGNQAQSLALTERQGRWLGRLPRDRQAVLFRDVLLDILALEGSDEPAVGAGSLELLGGFRGDQEVFQRVAILLERSLVGMEARAGYPGRLPFDASAARAVRILHGVDPERAAGLIHQALRRSMGLLHGPEARRDARPQLPKTAVGLLALEESGRGKLKALLGLEVPRRVRFEAALQLVKRDSSAHESVVRKAGQRLMLDFDGVDGALRLRAIEALGAPPLRFVLEIDEFLQRLTGPGNDEAERSTAIEAMGRRHDHLGLSDVLDSAIEAAGPDAGTIDAAANAARALRLAPNRSAARVALSRLASEALTKADERQLETVRGELLEALCALLLENEKAVQEGAESWVTPEEAEAVLGAVLAAPRKKARTQGAQQFQSGRRAEAHFLWASELAAVKSLLRRPALLRRALGGPDQWGGLDGRMQLALAQVLASSGAEALGPEGQRELALALELTTAAGVALAGEGDAPDLLRRRGEALWLQARLAGLAGASARSARAYRSLLGMYREGLLPRSVLRAMLPSLHRPEVLLHQRYWAALGGQAPDAAVRGRAAAWSALD